MALTERQKRTRAEYPERSLTITECSQNTPYCSSDVPAFWSC